jgi:hypothetical protein
VPTQQLTLVDTGLPTDIQLARFQAAFAARQSTNELQRLVNNDLQFEAGLLECHLLARRSGVTEQEQFGDRCRLAGLDHFGVARATAAAKGVARRDVYLSFFECKYKDKWKYFRKKEANANMRKKTFNLYEMFNLLYSDLVF